MSDERIVPVNKELGEGLLHAAKRKTEREIMNGAVEWASKIMKDKDNALLWAEQNQMAAKFYQEQLDAIAAGQFTIINNRQIRFVEDRLNQPVQKLYS